MNIYFSGIGGVGLGPLAQMALDAGHTVYGSDREQGLTTRELAAKGIEIRIGTQDGDHLRRTHEHAPLDWFVYTAALPHDHPELVAARALGIRTSKRDELIATLVSDSDQCLIAVAGTHGKTTATGMLVWTLQQLGVPVSYSIGSQISFGPSGKFDPNARFFIYECDEFDRNFLKFYPHTSLIVSIDYDHPDTYPTEADYQAAFRQFITQSRHTILWQHDADYIHFTESDTSTWILQPDETLPLKLAGAHNRRNATLVAKAIEHFAELDASSVARALEAFPGTIRRFEKLADNLYSDYGHHPTEITATLQLAREVSDHVVLVYQPHQNIRQHEIIEQYTDAVFDGADDVYWLPTYLSREDPSLAILTPEQLTAKLSSTSLHLSECDSALWEKIQAHLAAGHLVLGMGAGSIDSWLRTHAEQSRA